MAGKRITSDLTTQEKEYPSTLIKAKFLNTNLLKYNK